MSAIDKDVKRSLRSSSPDTASGSKFLKIGNDQEVGPQLPPSFSSASVDKTCLIENNKATIKSRMLAHQTIQHLSQIPTSPIYEVSYLHLSPISHVIFTPKTEFLVTASRGGHVKFWKKREKGIEFVKDYLVHRGAIIDMKVTPDGHTLCTVGADNALKIFEVINFDMINMLLLDFTPAACSWLTEGGSSTFNSLLLAISDTSSPLIRIFNAIGDRKQICRVIDGIHYSPVTVMSYCNVFDFAISGDSNGMLEIWSQNEDKYEFPKNKLNFSFKTDTDLYDLIKFKAKPYQITFSPNGLYFVVTASDRKLRIFQTLIGKLKLVLDESIEFYKTSHKKFSQMSSEESLQRADYLPEMEFNRRVAVDKELNKTGDICHWNAIFDESSTLLIYSSLMGIKIVRISSSTCLRIVGKDEGVRFLFVSLFQGVPSTHKSAMTINMTISDNPALQPIDPDPTIVSNAAKNNRFYLFTNREPLSISADDKDRDKYNERPSIEERLLATEINQDKEFRLARQAILHTTLGDIRLELYPEKCPKTVENFTVHSKNGYYNDVIFHRVINQFIIQTGDPLGDGTGGESIWGGDFADEIHPDLQHDKPYVLSMANSGPNTNGSQFFITVVNSPWLDGKHTVFGYVTKGMDVAVAISKVRVNKKTEKPYDDIKILSVSVMK